MASRASRRRSASRWSSLRTAGSGRNMRHLPRSRCPGDTAHTHGQRYRWAPPPDNRDPRNSPRARSDIVPPRRGRPPEHIRPASPGIGRSCNTQDRRDGPPSDSARPRRSRRSHTRCSRCPRRRAVPRSRRPHRRNCRRTPPSRAAPRSERPRPPNGLVVRNAASSSTSVVKVGRSEQADVFWHVSPPWHPRTPRARRMRLGCARRAPARRHVDGIRRRFERIARLLEIADEEFVSIRAELTEYQRYSSPTTWSRCCG